MKKIKYLAIILMISLFLGEIALRIYGFCQSPLYITSKEFEYIHAPNQNVVRFGNRVLTNEYSMRNFPLSDKDEIRVLLIGDSVINGGNPTDHDSLATTKLEKLLSNELNKRVRVLNISAGSWGPDNALAYLNKYGLFDASLVIAVFSSHDAYDVMQFDNIVGVHPSYPKEQYTLAYLELFDRYLFPRFIKKENNDKKLMIDKKEDILVV